MIETLDIFRTRPSLELFRFRYANARFHHFGVRDAETKALGCGGAASPLEAQRKALFEWIERRVFRRSGARTSSGWAAHATPEAASRAAALELVERDALLVSWLLRIPPKNLGPALFPAFGAEFPLLRFGTGPDFVVCGAVLESPSGRMLISTAAATDDEALAKLLVDSERALGALENGVSPSLAEHHRAFCEAPAASLAWLYQGGEGLSYGEPDVSCRVVRTPLWDGTEAFVAEARSGALQSLYFGPASLANLRRARLRALRKPGQKLNRARHPLL